MCKIIYGINSLEINLSEDTTVAKIREEHQDVLNIPPNKACDAVVLNGSLAGEFSLVKDADTVCFVKKSGLMGEEKN